ncbi:MAG: hypothetical protein ABFS16_14630 [Bacteroidota bacterium]
MKKILSLLTILVLVITVSSCGNKKKNAEHDTGTHVHEDGTVHGNHSHEAKPNQESFEVTSGNSEHKRDVGEGGEGEEDGTQFGLTDTYDVTKHDVRLVLKYDKTSNSFQGEMTNTTDKVVEKARVEVHLSNGIELGPTKAVTLSPGAIQSISIKASEKSFETWSTHAEVGSSEHGHSHGETGEHGHSHDEGGEHSHEHGEH